MTHYHFIGIGGSGLSAIARILLERGNVVTGSDRSATQLTWDLEKAGARIFTGHQPENVEGADLVIRSSAIPDSNPEVMAAVNSGIPVVKRFDFLDYLLAGRDPVAVAGTHGKTTTTAMIAWMLTSLGQDPSFIIGGISKNLGRNAHHGRGKYFVIEADEYDRMFLGMNPSIAVVTYLEHDHPDCYSTPALYRQAFVDFIHNIKPGGHLLLCQDNPGAAGLAGEIGSNIHSLTYGLSVGADFQAQNLVLDQNGAAFEVVLPGKRQSVQLLVSGEHNVRNALAALSVGYLLDLPLDLTAAALREFQGTERRFDVIGEFGGVTIINDYAHHPTAIRTTLEAARTRYPGRQIWALWQPHTYSRTRSLKWEFSGSFQSADHVLISAIYAAREVDDGFSAGEVVQGMKHPDAHYIPGLNEIKDYLIQRLAPGDVLLVLSAGDADLVSASLRDYYLEREALAQ